MGALLAYRSIVGFGALTVGQGPSLREASSSGIAVYISFARSSPCLAAPEIYKALNPKTEKISIASFIFT